MYLAGLNSEWQSYNGDDDDLSAVHFDEWCIR